MHNISLKDVMKIIQTSLDSMGDMLQGHGEQVAYIFWKILDYTKQYSSQDLLNLCALSLFHDIGAYKTDQRKALREFEIQNPHNHAIYGYLFIKHFSPLSHLADIVLHHHVDYSNHQKIDSSYIEEIYLLHLADRISILFYSEGKIDTNYLYFFAGHKFSKQHINLFIQADAAYHITENLESGAYKDELYAFFDTSILSFNDIMAYARMLTYSIDFRSEHTVTHTIMVTKLSEILAAKLHLDIDTTQVITLSAMVHDIGKISTPVSILEKPGKLTNEEMDIMKQHVVVTHNILQVLGMDEILEIASLHHEKLDGSGYPNGLTGKSLSIPARIVCIADILSALLGVRSYKPALSKDTILRILDDMVSYNKIDADIVKLIKEDYDAITKTLHTNCEALLKTYSNFKEEQLRLSTYFKQNYAHIYW